MIVVQEQANPQTIQYIVRYGTEHQIYLTDENTNVTVLVPTPTFIGGDYVNSATAIFPVEENHFYWMQIKDISGNLLLKERMFCTNQPIDTFSVNDGEYISNQTTNDFIMYE